MKKILVFLLVGGLLFGCSGFQITTDEHTTPVLARIAARNVGCEVAKLGDPEIDRSLRNIYDLVKTGELSQDAINQLNELSAKYTEDHPTLVADVLDLVSLFGVQFDQMDQAEQIQIPIEVMDAVAVGYVQGYDLCLGLSH